MKPKLPSRIAIGDTTLEKLLIHHDLEVKKGRSSYLDLSKADLRGAYLRGQNLQGCRFVELREAYLGKADLSNCSLDGVCFDSAFLREANLRLAQAVGGSFDGAICNDCDMTGIYAENASFKDSSLLNANLRNATLNGSTFIGTSLRGADLSGTKFIGSILRNVDFRDARFNYTNLSFVRFDECIFGNTYFYDLDLSRVAGLETCRHFNQSHFDLDTLVKSRGSIPASFLSASGLPETLVAYHQSLFSPAVHFKSVFISYSSLDWESVKEFSYDLRRRGVNVFAFETDARYGELVWEEIDQSIRLQDKFILVCSIHSLQSQPVLRELERALMREDSQKVRLLFPIRIDEFLLRGWDHPRKADVVRYVVADFSEWRDKEKGKYEAALERALDALQIRQGTRANDSFLKRLIAKV